MIGGGRAISKETKCREFQDNIASTRQGREGHMTEMMFVLLHFLDKI